MISWGRGACAIVTGTFFFDRDFLDIHEIIETLFDVLKKEDSLNAWIFIDL